MATREHILHPGAVMVVPVLDSGELVMERQYRYPGADLGILVTRGRLQTDEHELTERALAWISGIKAQFGGAPAVEGQRLNASIVVQSLLKTPEEFAAIPLRTNPDGSIVRVRSFNEGPDGGEFEGMSSGPWLVGRVAEEVAKIKRLPVDEAVYQLTVNTCRVFDIVWA